MSRYKRVLAAIELDQRGEQVARQAWSIAREAGAAFAIAHVIDYGDGIHADHIPFLTPQETAAKIDALVRRRLLALAGQIGAANAAVVTGFGEPATGLSEIVLAWQPHLVVVGLQAPHGLTHGQALRVVSGSSCVVADTLVVPNAGNRGRGSWMSVFNWLKASRA